jgi:protein phosphatase
MQPPPSTPRPHLRAARAGEAAAPRLHVAAPLPIDAAALSDPGRAREGNEDSFLVISRPPVLAVCDGMGGAAAGEVASGMTVDVIREAMTRGGEPATREALGRRLLGAVEEAARRVHAASLASRARRGMGTTATACAVAGDTLYVAQVGDSRAYLLREGVLTQLTRDQTLATLMVERGQLAPEDVPTFPLGHVILQAVGTAPCIEVDLKRVRLARGDVILVCSDGLSGVVPHDTLRDVLAREPTAAAACAALVALANEAGGPDNVTAVVAMLRGDLLPPPAGPPAPEAAPIDPPAQDTPAPAPVTSATADSVEKNVLARLAAVFRRRRRPRQT